ncbi:hypothetical protein BDW62DRAFT_206446 [Aspergillus aurantiobrunneus]
MEHIHSPSYRVERQWLKRVLPSNERPLRHFLASLFSRKAHRPSRKQKPRVNSTENAEWAFELDDLWAFYRQIFTYSRFWASQYLDLRPQLAPTAVENFGRIVGELLIYLTIHERLFENPFWYLDANPTYGVLWKMQTHRLANSHNHHYAPNPKFGQYNADRHEAALAGFADDLMASEPFCWLIRDVAGSASTMERRENLIDIFRKAVRTMIKCETWTNGQPDLRGINELGGRILLVTRQGLVYVDDVTQGSLRATSRVTEIIDADILPVYVKEDVDDEGKDEDGGAGKHGAYDEN